MNLFAYISFVISFYLFYFFVFTLISNKLKKERLKREKELEKEFENKETESNTPDPETEEYFKELDRMFEKREIRGFYVSILCIIILLILIIISLFNNFRIDFNQYIHLLYYIVPFILLRSMQDGWEYFRKKYLKKAGSGDRLQKKNQGSL